MKRFQQRTERIGLTVSHERNQRGFVLITMTAAAIATMLVVGLAVDLGRVFIAKNEVQTFCDTAALAAALDLDGQDTGIANAKAAVTSSVNKWNFGTQTPTSVATTFSTTSGGSYVATPPTPGAGSTNGILYVKVVATAPVSLFFMPVMNNIFSTNVNSQAIAGQVALTSFPQGLAPYTSVGTGPAPNFGFTVGDSYNIQWPQYNGNRGGCNNGNPDKCFNSAPCPDETKAAENAVVDYWAASISGYWGSQNNSTIAAEVLDLIQIEPVSIGTDIFPVLTSGNKASQAGDLDTRVNEDNDTSTNVPATYLSDPTHNGRRLIQVPVVDPASNGSGGSTSIVNGYAEFLLEANGPGVSNLYTKLNGNDGFCAIYMGPYNIGSLNPGAGGSTGATYVKLVQ